MRIQFYNRSSLARAAATLLAGLLAAACPVLGAAADSPAKSLRIAAAPRTVPPATKPAQVTLELTYPAGKSPKVFTSGWIFGARVVEPPGKRLASGVIRWSGTGTFQPSEGAVSRPVFSKPGTNRITLTLVENGRAVAEKSFTVDAVDPNGFARVGDLAFSPNYRMGCPACPHPVRGPIRTGSPNVFIGGIPAARVGDTGVTSGGCGLNTYTVKTGAPSVLIDGKLAARLNDQTLHSDGSKGRIDALVGR